MKYYELAKLIRESHSIICSCAVAVIDNKIVISYAAEKKFKSLRNNYTIKKDGATMQDLHLDKSEADEIIKKVLLEVKTFENEVTYEN